MSKNIIFHIITLFITVVLFLPKYSNAQAPGYTGKRFGISFELPVMPGATLFADDYDYYKYINSHDRIPMNHQYSRLSFKYRPTFAIEYITNRKSSFQLFGRFYSPMVDVSSFDSTVVDKYGNSDRVTFIPSDRAKMKTMSFGVRYKMFTTKNINPIGNYVSLGLEYSRIKFEFNGNKHFTAPHPDYDVVLYGTPPPSVSNNIYLLMGLGKQYPLSSFLLFNLGFEFGLPLNHIFDLTRSDSESSGFFPTFDGQKSLDWTVRNASHENIKYTFLSLNLGFTFMP